MIASCGGISLKKSFCRSKTQCVWVSLFFFKSGSGYQFRCNFSWEIRSHNGRNAISTCATGKQQ